MIIRDKPYLILNIRNKVYKFLPKDLLKKEKKWLQIKPLLNQFNIKTNKKKLELPFVEFSPFYTKTKYLGEDLFKLGSNIIELYESIKDFSYMFLDNKKTISLGDIQLRNVYLNESNFVVSDLGIQAGKDVNVYYDRARFLVNLIDCSYIKEANILLDSEKDKNYILFEMDKRYKKVTEKRIKNFKIFSASYRFFKYIKWRIF